MAPTEYSGTPLAKKLGIKTASKLMLVNAPGNYFDLFTDMPADVIVTAEAGVLKDVIHIFTKSKDEYMFLLPHLKTQLVQNGMIWVSWPKKASKMYTDITEDIARNFALQSGLVDVKICAVDAVWSGLKLVIRLVDRVM